MRQRRDICHSFDRDGVYEIHIDGKVAESMLECLSGMTVSRQRQSNGGDMDITVLTGWLPDQAALNGVLNALYDRHYTLVLVRKTPPDSIEVE